jgi:hypothetical protein
MNAAGARTTPFEFAFQAGFAAAVARCGGD